MSHLYEINDLVVSFTNEEGRSIAVNGVSFYLDKGEIISFVGESGSGKSVTQLAGLQLIASPPGKIERGHIMLEGKDLLTYKQNGPELQKVRGGKVGMIFQEPMTSLDPVKTIGYQIMESVLIHHKCSKEEAQERTIGLLSDVGIPDARTRLNDYPHQFSGGMRQRIMIAIAISGDPEIIIADEPTTALDVTTQAQILDLLQDISKKRGTALLIVTHNLGIVARYAQRIYVMYAGNVVESGTAEDIFTTPCHPYTRGLLKAVPRLDDSRERKLIPIPGTPLSPANRPKGCPFAGRCKYWGEQCHGENEPPLRLVGENQHFSACVLKKEELEAFDKQEKEEVINRGKQVGSTLLSVQDLKVYFDIRKGIFKRKIGELKVIEGISFDLRKGETIGLVGESGCGKTTVAKSILQLYPQAQGNIIFEGKDMKKLSKEELRRERKNIQMIFQDPYSSLNPRKTVEQMIGEPLKTHKLVKSSKEYFERVDELLKLVGLDPSLKERYAHEFSGGQRQRVGIARALASDPKLIVCDEPISALDVSIQAQIINLLEELQRKMGLTYIFIAHDLSVVKHISDVIAVMYLGKIVEIAPCEELYHNPQHPYTKALLAAIPIPDPMVERAREKVAIEGEVPSVVKRPAGCSFSDRCPHAIELCRREMPQYVETTKCHYTACYLMLEAEEREDIACK